MAEVLGAVASATQLAAMAMGLIDTVQKIKGASKTLKRYQQQLVEIQHLSESISQNPLLQTTDVEYHVQSILSNISQTDLEHCLRKGWLFRAYTLVRKDRDLVDTFSILDHQKLSLSLVIENIQAHAIHQIQSDVQILSCNTRPDMSSDTPRGSDDKGRPDKEIANTKAKRKTNRSSSGQGEGYTTIPNSTNNGQSSHGTDDASIPGLRFGRTFAGHGVTQMVGLNANLDMFEEGSGTHAINPGESDSFGVTEKFGDGDSYVGVNIGVYDDVLVGEDGVPHFQYSASFDDIAANTDPAVNSINENRPPALTTLKVGRNFISTPRPNGADR